MAARGGGPPTHTWQAKAFHLRDYKEIVFIEVKARSSDINDRFVSFNQQKRIKRAAEMFLSSNTKYNHYNIRFDLVIVSPYKLPIIIKNAW